MLHAVSNDRVTKKLRQMIEGKTKYFFKKHKLPSLVNMVITQKKRKAAVSTLQPYHHKIHNQENVTIDRTVLRVISCPISSAVVKDDHFYNENSIEHIELQQSLI